MRGRKVRRGHSRQRFVQRVVERCRTVTKLQLRHANKNEKDNATTQACTPSEKASSLEKKKSLSKNISEEPAIKTSFHVHQNKFAHKPRPVRLTEKLNKATDVTTGVWDRTAGIFDQSRLSLPSSSSHPLQRQRQSPYTHTLPVTLHHPGRSLHKS